MPVSRLKILVVGAGRFGAQHLAEWHHLAAAGEVELAGIVVSRPETRHRLQQERDVPVHCGLDDELVRRVDAVDIVTPSPTHAALVRQCLPRAHVLVEKPLAVEAGEAAELARLARSLGRVLMVGHVFRFHPVVRALKRLVAAIPHRPRGILGTMTDPDEDGVVRADPNLEILHLFDIVDFLFAVEPEVSTGRRSGQVNEVSLRYPGPMTALLRIGWEGEEKIRRLGLVYEDRQITADLADNTIVVSTRDTQLERHVFPAKPGALREELRTFLAAIRDARTPHPDGAVGERIVRVAVAAGPRRPTNRPRVAVIGGGIFGATSAIELATVADVSLFERHGQLLAEASWANQRRHHSGFHYPRSYSAMAEVRAARQDFEAEYGDAVLRDVPAYVCTAASGVEIPAERYLAACRASGLSFALAAPPEEVVDRSKVSLCLRTDEAVYDLGRLRQLVSERLQRNANVRLHLGTSVVSGVIAGDGSKRLTVSGPDGAREEVFDYLVNATYANRNVVARWFDFPVDPVRFDLYELLLLRLPIPQVCVTIFDGPFTTLIGTGRDDWFLLSHIHDSVSRSVIPADGAPPAWGAVESNRWSMLRHSARYLPVLKEASGVQSLWSTRVIQAFSQEPDARPTMVTCHGFGCWSVLGGKIITAVTSARQIASEILVGRSGTDARR